MTVGTVQRFNRATEPDMQALANALAPILPASGAPFASYDAVAAQVAISFADWTGIDLNAVQAAVTACPQRTTNTDDDHYIDNMSKIEQANYLTILDQINLIRSRLPVPLGAITVQQYINAVKAKRDSLG